MIIQPQQKCSVLRICYKTCRVLLQRCWRGRSRVFIQIIFFYMSSRTASLSDLSPFQYTDVNVMYSSLSFLDNCFLKLQISVSWIKRFFKSLDFQIWSKHSFFTEQSAFNASLNLCLRYFVIAKDAEHLANCSHNFSTFSTGMDVASQRSHQVVNAIFVVTIPKFASKGRLVFASSRCPPFQTTCT